VANIRDIKTRIDSVKNTKQITNAMKMVAAAKLRRSQDSIVQARPYADQLSMMLSQLRARNRDIEHEVMQRSQDNEKCALIVVTSDKGLCGAFNSNIIKRAKSYLEQHPTADVICLGRKGFDTLKKESSRIIKEYLNLFNEMDFTISHEIGEYLMQLFLEEGYGKIEVVYNEFKSAIQQDIVVKQILPIVPQELDEDEHNPELLCEPDEETLVEEMANKYIDVELWRIMLESSAAEQGARMTAMDSATENAAELIDELSLSYNRIRQAGITKEIIEISSGAAAIN
jgi:F-type H+-transporting ATPase subunit gamma